MIEIRFYGRGGQEAAIASKILAAAFFKEDKHVQAYPAFGTRRRGTPVMAFTSFDKRRDPSPVSGLRTELRGGAG